MAASSGRTAAVWASSCASGTVAPSWANAASRPFSITHTGGCSGSASATRAASRSVIAITAVIPLSVTIHSTCSQEEVS